MRFQGIFPIQTLCMCFDSVPVSAQVTLLMASSPSFPISGIFIYSKQLKLCEPYLDLFESLYDFLAHLWFTGHNKLLICYLWGQAPTPPQGFEVMIAECFLSLVVIYVRCNHESSMI